MPHQQTQDDQEAPRCRRGEAACGRRQEEPDGEQVHDARPRPATKPEYFETPGAPGVSATSISVTEHPRAWARTTKNRCQSCRRWISSRIEVRNALIEFRSDTGTSEDARESAVVDGRHHPLSYSPTFRPQTMSHPSEHFARNRGISSGECWRSASKTTRTARSVAGRGEHRLGLSRGWSGGEDPKRLPVPPPLWPRLPVPSVEPSSTRMTSPDEVVTFEGAASSRIRSGMTGASSKAGTRRRSPAAKRGELVRWDRPPPDQTRFRIRAGRIAELVPVLGHGAAGDLDSVRLEQLHDLLVGERLLGVLLLHQRPDLVLHAPGRDVLAGNGGEPAREEELEGEHPAGSARTSRSSPATPWTRASRCARRPPGG
jgi:hypothetical protein